MFFIPVTENLLPCNGKITFLRKCLMKKATIYTQNKNVLPLFYLNFQLVTQLLPQASKQPLIAVELSKLFYLIVRKMSKIMCIMATQKVHAQTQH